MMLFANVLEIFAATLVLAALVLARLLLRRDVIDDVRPEVEPPADPRPVIGHVALRHGIFLNGGKIVTFGDGAVHVVNVSRYAGVRAAESARQEVARAAGKITVGVNAAPVGSSRAGAPAAAAVAGIAIVDQKPIATHPQTPVANSTSRRPAQKLVYAS